MRFGAPKPASLGALFGAMIACAFSFNARAGLQIDGGCNKQFIDRQQSPGYEKTWREEIEKSPANAKWTSCYRSAAEQRAACQKICGADHCPDKCAPPGRSNHQKVATADVGGLPGDVKAGCEYLYKVCQNMRAQDRGLGCEIGGYGAGSHHLAVGPGIKNSAYNQCAYLKPKMGADPGNPDKLKKDGDDLFNQIMKAAPAAMQAAQALAPKDSGSSPASSDPAAQYPTDTRSPSGTGGSGGHDSSAPPPKDTGSSRNPPDRISFQLPPGVTPTRTGPDGGVASPSDITRPGSGSSYGSGGAGSGEASRNSSGSSSAGGGGGGSLGSGGGAKAAAGAGTSSADAAALGASEEFSPTGGGGMKFGGGGKGGGAGKDSGPEPDSLVKSAIEQAQESAERGPASKENDGIEAQDSDSLFLRCHEAYRRCALGGCVSTR